MVITPLFFPCLSGQANVERIENDLSRLIAAIDSIRIKERHEQRQELLKIKWLAEYCGTSVATIERRYGKYIKSDAAEQLERLAGTVIPTVTPDNIKRVAVGQGVENFKGKELVGPPGLEPGTNRL